MSSVTLSCPICHGALEIDTQLAGQQVQCPLCQGLLELPPPEVLFSMLAPQPPVPMGQPMEGLPAFGMPSVPPPFGVPPAAGFAPPASFAPPNGFSPPNEMPPQGALAPPFGPPPPAYGIPNAEHFGPPLPQDFGPPAPFGPPTGTNTIGPPSGYPMPQAAMPPMGQPVPSSGMAADFPPPPSGMNFPPANFGAPQGSPFPTGSVPVGQIPVGEIPRGTIPQGQPAGDFGAAAIPSGIPVGMPLGMPVAAQPTPPSAEVISSTAPAPAKPAKEPKKPTVPEGSVALKCPRCSGPLTVPLTAGGREIACNHCKRQMTLPAREVLARMAGAPEAAPQSEKAPVAEAPAAKPPATSSTVPRSPRPTSSSPAKSRPPEVKPPSPVSSGPAELPPSIPSAPPPTTIPSAELPPPSGRNSDPPPPEIPAQLPPRSAAPELPPQAAPEIAASAPAAESPATAEPAALELPPSVELPPQLPVPAAELPPAAMEQLLPTSVPPTEKKSRRREREVEDLLPPGAELGLPPAAEIGSVSAEVPSYRTAADALLPPGADDAPLVAPGKEQALPQPEEKPAPGSFAPPPGAPGEGLVTLPTADGRYTTIRDTGKIIGRGENEIELRRLTPEEKARRRTIRNIIMAIFSLALLGLVSWLMIR